MVEIPNTLEAFKWASRDTALWAVRQYSPAGGIDAVQKVLVDLGIADMPYAPGLRFRNTYDMERMPDGTIISQFEPESPNNYNVWAIQHRRQVHLLGTGRISHGLYTIREVPGVPNPPAWLDVKASAQQSALLAEWKRTCWQVAYAAKVRHGWCGDFETVMFSMEVRGV